MSGAPTGGDSGSGGRLYARLVVLLIGLATVAVLLRLSSGEVDRSTWIFLGSGAACGLAGLCGWRFLARLPRRGGRPGVLAWLAFPATLFGTLGMALLLLLAAFPEARDLLDPESRIEARLRDGGLEIVFPRAVRGEAINVTLDDVSIPPAHFQELATHGGWRDLEKAEDRRLLWIDIDAIRDRFAIRSPRRIGINAAPGAQVFYRSGERVPQQWLPFPAEGSP